jgi:hypothetical protein
MVAKVASSLAGLGAGVSDGQPGIVRVGTWPDQHEIRMWWNQSLAKWVGEEMVLANQSDQWGINMGHVNAAASVADFVFPYFALPYGKNHSILNGAHTLPVGTITVASAATFAASGKVQIRDSTVTYTGKTGTTLTGCTGGSGTYPDKTDVVQGEVGGWGTQSRPLLFAQQLWSAGFRLQENLSAMMNGSDDGKAMTLGVYWHQMDLDDNPNFFSPSGGLGISAQLVGPSTTLGWPKPQERAFAMRSTGWIDYVGSAPTKKFMIPHVFAKMAAGAIDTGEFVDSILRVRWIG